MLKKLLVATALVAGLAAPASAAVVGTFGTNPPSANGFFANDPNGAGVGGLFTDYYTFDLTESSFIVVANATNTFADGIINGSNYIQNFAAAIFETVGTPGGGDDILVFGPQFATLNTGARSQSLNGIGELDPGSYYLQIAGNAGSLAGYGGNFSVTPLAAVPEPATWFMMILGFAGVSVMAMRKRRQGVQLRLV